MPVLLIQAFTQICRESKPFIALLFNEITNASSATPFLKITQSNSAAVLWPCGHRLYENNVTIRGSCLFLSEASALASSGCSSLSGKEVL